jgi:SAM-dependent methyltransferase
MSSYSRHQLEAWLKTISIPAGSKVLDIGGSQNPIKGRLKDWNIEEDDDYRILDLAIPHETKAKPDIISDIQIDYYEGFPYEEFDVAFCIEVSEYWYNPLQALRNISYFLKKGGILYISFHFIYPMHKPIGKDYLRYTLHGAVKLLEEAGFETIEVEQKWFNNSSLAGLLYANEKMRGLENWTAYQGCLIKARKV